MKYLALLAALSVALAAPGAPAEGAAANYDRLVVGVGNLGTQVVLPGGEFGPYPVLDEDIEASVFLPDGRQLAAGRYWITPLGPAVLALYEVLADGGLRMLSSLDPPPGGPSIAADRAEEMAVDREGRLFLLSRDPSLGFQRLSEVRVADFTVVATRQLDYLNRLYGLATAGSGGLWTFDEERCLRRLDPATGLLGERKYCSSDLSGVTVHAADTDSAGRIYFSYSSTCTPPCDRLARLDAQNGQLNLIPFGSGANPPLAMRWLAIDRSCEESPSAICLQDGRFRAEMVFSDYVGFVGIARKAEARSSDTGIFSFFDPDNWELMVKVLDGCNINSRFWVYAAASTDVEYELTVTDTETGARQVYGNPLGHIATTVTDNQAFACTPADLAAAAATLAGPAAPAGPAEPVAAIAPSAASAAALLPASLPYDELLTYDFQNVVRSPLPGGPTGAPLPTPPLMAMQAMPDGRVLAVSAGEGGEVMLSELRDDGSLANIGFIGVPGNPPLAIGEVADLATDPLGNLWMLHPRPELSELRALSLINAENGYVMSFWTVPAEITAIAPGPRGLWAAGEGRLFEIVALPGIAVQPTAILTLGYGTIRALDTDSAGRVYFSDGAGNCTPASCARIGIYDPSTGRITAAQAGLPPRGLVQDLTIRRRCADSSTVRCLAGGRFRAEVTYEGYDGAAGPARATEARSADTGIFSFFDSTNWEQMVKVLDGCSVNSHYWVYAAASTDVAFELAVTDTETGAQKIYRNPLGQVAVTVTDNLAFPCGRNG